MAYVSRSPAVDTVGVKHLPAPGWFVMRFLRSHPLTAYFLLAFGLTWAWEIPVFAISHRQFLGPFVLVGPSLAGFLMAGITEGRAGMVRLARRFLIWRVSFRWYLVALLALPAIWLAGVVFMPGAISAFRVPGLSFVLTYLGAFGFAFLGAFSMEEFGWRGFALPRMQVLHGPFVATLFLGLLWALWHMPAWAFFPSATGAGSSPFSITFAITFLEFTCQIVALAILITWLFNHTRGSMLLAVTVHASTNAGAGSFLLLFPSLFPNPLIPVAYIIALVVVATVIVVVTRGRLGYDRYLREA